MSDKIINLNKARKAKAKREAKSTADRNAFRFGQTKAAKQKAKKLQDQINKRLDGHELHE